MGWEAVRNAEQRRINGRASESHQPHTFNHSLSERSQSDSQKLWRFLKCCRKTLGSRRRRSFQPAAGFSLSGWASPANVRVNKTGVWERKRQKKNKQKQTNAISTRWQQSDRASNHEHPTASVHTNQPHMYSVPEDRLLQWITAIFQTKISQWDIFYYIVATNLNQKYIFKQIM